MTRHPKRDLEPSPLILDGDPLDVIGGGKLVGYARVSSVDQNLDRQIDALNDLHCVRVFTEKLAGRDAERPELWKCLDYLRPGDTLVVLELSRLGRNLHDLLSIVAGLRKRGIGFRSLHEALDTTTPGGRLVFHVFAALAEFIRELIVQGTREGMAAARARGVRIGRPPAMTPEQIAHARDLLTQPKNTVASIARLLGVSRATIYKHVPELADSGAAVSTPRLAALATAEPITVPLLAERTVPDTLTCPSCGSVPDGANDRFQHRRDLAVLWFYADDTDPYGIRVQRHCPHCQPHDQLAVVECALCGQGPMLSGELAASMTGDALPELAARRLTLAGWRTAPDLVCPNHTRPTS
jgi:DNA invertase Pin-like site-specific DNA recombinase